MAIDLLKKVLGDFRIGEPESFDCLGGTATLKYAVKVWSIRSQWIQIRLRGSRKVPKTEKLSFVLDHFFEMIDWLDHEAEDFFRRLKLSSTG